MVLEPALATQFIRGYTMLLLEIGGTDHQDQVLLYRLAAARILLANNPKLLDLAVESLIQRFVEVDAQVVAALRSLRLKKWVYLRDTRSYSVFLDDESEEAFAVSGLNDRLRDIVGDSGAFLETGLLPFAGRFICDGIITQVVWLGRGIRGELNEAFQEIKSAGRFYVTAPALD
jgi:hypothetical protein